MTYFKQSIIEKNSNNDGLACVWIYYMGDDEEDIAMWEEASVVSSTRSERSSLPEEEEEDDDDNDGDNVPARTSICSREQEVEQYVRTSVSSALDRARQRHSLNLEQRRLSSSSLSPSMDRKSLGSPALQRRMKVRQSLVSSLSLRNMEL